MLPEKKIRSRSTLFRFQKFFYCNSCDPADTCEFKSRLLKIVLLWIPLFLGLVVFPMIYAVGVLIFGMPEMRDSLFSLFLVTSFTLGIIEWLVVAGICLFFVINTYQRRPVFKKLLNYSSLIFFVVLLVWSLVLIVSGQSLFSLGEECGSLNMVISLFGLLVWPVAIALAIITIVVQVFDSKTYRTLNASAREKWCARIVIVDENDENNEKQSNGE